MYIWILNHHAREYGRHPSLAKYLAESGENVTLFSSSFLHNTFKETKNYRDGEYYQEEEKDNYKRVYIKTPPYRGNGIKRLLNQISFSKNAYKVGKKKLQTESTPEVVIGSSVHLFTGIAAYFLAKKANAKFVFEIRDIWPQTLVDLGALKKDSFATKVFEKIEKFLYKKADLIVSVLPNGENHINKYGISREKVLYLPNGIDVNSHQFALKKELNNLEIKQFFKNKQESFIVSYTGAHGVANGLDTPLEAAALLQSVKTDKKIEFLFVGDGPEKEKLKQIAKEKKLYNVTFIDRVEKDQVAHILNLSDVCLFHLNKTPVFKYGISSNKLFDYMISGKPMIFAVDTSYDFVEQAGNGISIQPENPVEMKEAILTLARTDPKTMKTMGENGVSFVKERHDLKKLSLKLKNSLIRK